MTFTFASLEAEALTLSMEERARLADHLMASLDPEKTLDEAWATEVERRIVEVEAGRMHVVPVDTAIAHARQAIE